MRVVFWQCLLSYNSPFLLLIYILKYQTHHIKAARGELHVHNIHGFPLHFVAMTPFRFHFGYNRVSVVYVGDVMKSGMIQSR